ncbi:hypothetical protein L210DRAFT_3191311 [Boletus edulis BED1]|uniref:Uncharacterized protein n=1 Tax=Boletus edulis BED1 TaxID=1328754 RepID=A0AAD4BX24_BOLED|nr:hypothetical protein L210DRAFT_3191311 [Boletus edulis BED1]
MAAAAVSLACPLRRSTRLAHAHHPSRKYNQLRHSTRSRRLLLIRPRKRAHSPRPPCSQASATHSRPGWPPFFFTSSLKETPEGKHHPHPANPVHRRAGTCSLWLPLRRLVPQSHSTATPTHAASPTSVPEPISDSAIENRPPSPSCLIPRFPPQPELSIPLPPISPNSSPSSSDSEPLTPLTPLTPSPESSPSLPGHDRQPLPPQDPLPVSLHMPEPTPTQQQSSSDPFTPSPLPPPLDPAFNTLIPFDGLHPQFDPELSVQIPPPPTPPQLQALELQGQFHSFPQHQLYVPPNPVFVRDREINIWKLACQERVDCLLRRYGTDYIKALVESQAQSVSSETQPSPSPSQTKFRLYTPASYTYSLSSWGSTSAGRWMMQIGWMQTSTWKTMTKTTKTTMTTLGRVKRSAKARRR